MKKFFKKPYTLDTFHTLLFYFAILFFIIGFGFRDAPTPFGWYQQFMPNLSNFQVSDIFFLDSLTGWAVTGNSNPNDTSGYILKTTNGGDNWILKFTDVRDFSRVKFINSNTGFVSGGYGNGAKLYKSTDSGNNWFTLYSPFLIDFSDMSVLNNDTIWLVDPINLEGGVFRTTNGGLNWTPQYTAGNNNPSHIYMYNARIGFMNGGGLQKTTDGGATWNPKPGYGNFIDMYFKDSLTGWKANADIKKTTDGGLTWQQQTLPIGGNIITHTITKISRFGNDSLWGCCTGEILWNNGTQSRDILYRTINGGLNWYFQIPDTSMSFSNLSSIKFINKFNGWTYAGSPHGLHTVTGGDSIFYTGIKKISSKLPDKFILGQNYPNPFNPVTRIKASLSPSEEGKQEVKLIVYDITGKKIAIILDGKFSAGTYEVTFDGTNYSSGVYFYSLYVDGKLIDTKRMVLIK